MGFLTHGGETSAPGRKRGSPVSLETLYAHGCKVCPLKTVEPKMEPTGAEEPLIYMLGEAPGREEIKKGVQFVGTSGKVLRLRIPDRWLPLMRWNNSVRSHPTDAQGNNRTPTEVEQACCKPSVVKDIERSKPFAIFAFGGIALNLVLGETKITNWAGRCVPVKIGSHECWLMPHLHPSYIAHLRRFEHDDPSKYACEEEFAFALSMERGFDLVERLQPAFVTSPEAAQQGITILGVEGGEAAMEYELERVVDAIRACRHHENVGTDLETNMLRPYADDARILSIALATRDGSVSFGLDHPGARWTERQRRIIIDELSDFLYRYECRKLAHHVPFEQEWLGHFFGHDCILAQPWGCSECQGFLLDERPGTLSLDFLCLQRYGFNLKAISNLDRAALERAPLRDVLRYNGLDAKFHLRLFEDQAEDIREQGLQEVYEHQIRRATCLSLTTLQGMPVFPEATKWLYGKYKAALDEVEREIDRQPIIRDFKDAKQRPYRPSADQDITYMFRTLLGIPIDDAKAETLKHVDHPLAELTIKWKQLAKVLSTYLITKVHPDGKTHPTFSVCRTRTNRTSADDDNVQNWPKRTDAVEVRSQIAVEDDHVLVAIDFASIQARNVAMESRDPNLTQAFIDHYDIHKDWLEEIVRRYPRWVKEGAKQLAHDEKLFKKHRYLAKNKFVFPSFFGAHGTSVAGYLDVPEDVAFELQDALWAKFPHIKEWQEELEADYYRLGYVAGLNGFRRHAPIKLSQIINSPIQGDEARIVLNAHANVVEAGYQLDLPELTPICEIHDDLMWHWPRRDLDRNLEIVLGAMLRVDYEWIDPVPLAVEVSIGSDWFRMKEIGKFESVTRTTWREYHE